MLVALLGVAFCWLAALGLVTWPRSRRWLLAPAQGRTVPWSGFEVLLAVYATRFFWPPLCYYLLTSTGFFTWLYPSPADDPLGLLPIRQGLWATLFYFPFSFLTVPVAFRLLSGTRLEQLGFTCKRLGRDALLGVVACTLITPIAYGILAGISYLEMPTELHPLSRLAQRSMTSAETCLLIFSAVVSAPLLEELMFRGVLQPWLGQRSWGGHLAMAAAFLLSLVVCGSRLWNGWSDGSFHLNWPEFWPAAFVLAMVPGYLLIARRPSHAAVYGTSLLFAALHSDSWPHPIPLFALGLCLGCLAQRTRSLTSPIVVHALFNGFACAAMFVHG